MSELLTCDASAIVSLITATDSTRDWVRSSIARVDLLAPSYMPVEVANTLRRGEAAGNLAVLQARQAHQDLLSLEVDLWPHSLLANRAWELRHNLTIYDACYVALAEETGSALITLDRRLSRAPGIRCEVRCPPEVA